MNFEFNLNFKLEVLNYQLFFIDEFIGNKGGLKVTGRVNHLKKLTKKQYDIIKELSLIGAVVMIESFGIDEEKQDALESLISMCGGAEIDDNGECIFEYDFNEKYLNAYNEVIFWRGLAERLSIRDTLLDLGYNITEDNIEKYEKIKKIYYDKYLKEFRNEDYSNKLLPY